MTSCQTIGQTQSAQVHPSSGVSMENVLPFALNALDGGEKICLVTLVGLEGSGPRAVGTQMVVTQSGQSAGSFSGGCLEGVVAAEAVEAIGQGEARLIRFGKGSPYFDIVLPCGSGLDLFFDPHQDCTQLRKIMTSISNRQPAVMALDLDRAQSRDELSPLTGERRYFDCKYFPVTRLCIAGDNVAASLLARLACEAGLDVVHFDRADKNLLEDALDEWTAFTLLFHDHEKEHDFLKIALRSECFYIGALGSHETQRNRRQWLKEQGFPARKIADIHAPIGLIPGAKSPTELAVSILADVVASARTLSV